MARMFRDIMSEEEYRRRLWQAKYSIALQDAWGKSVYQTCMKTNGFSLREFCEASSEEHAVAFYMNKEVENEK